MTAEEILSLFAKDYLTERQFENYLYQYSDKFEKALTSDIYFELISANYGSKTEMISLKHKIAQKYISDFEKINDSYIERQISDCLWIEKLKRDNSDSKIIEMLRENEKKAERIIIDLSIIENEKQLIWAIKLSLKIPAPFGTNWDSVYDIGEAFLPKRLIFSGYHDFEKRQPKAAAKIIKWFSEINIGECVFDFF